MFHWTVSTGFSLAEATNFFVEAPEWSYGRCRSTYLKYHPNGGNSTCAFLDELFPTGENLNPEPFLITPPPLNLFI